MSRHRTVRSMNYEDEYDGYDDVYSHSVEDDYCISPCTAAQFTFDRTNPHSLSSFLASEDICEEEEEDEEEATKLPEATAEAEQVSPALRLNAADQTRLNACLEDLRSVLAESVTDQQMVEAVITAKFDTNAAINSLLNVQPSAGAKLTTTPPLPPARPTPAAPVDAPPSGRLQFGLGASDRPASDRPVADDLLASFDALHTSTPVARGRESTKRGAEPSRRDLQRVDGAWLAKSASAAELTGLAGQLSATPARKEPRSCTPTPRSATKTKSEKVDLTKAYELRRAADGKDCINLVVTGHVDAGKSTLMGHLLYQLGFVAQRVLHKYEQDAKKIGKASFAFAWVLDETDEERSRGVTMDVAQTKFETENKVVTLLDAPGHKDFIPNMITGAAQADVAMLVVNATRGEFETGFESGGQTREHAMLVRSLGVSQLLVAVNKMDTVEWSEHRYAEITRKLAVFLRHAGFREADVAYVPCSGLGGHNLSRGAPDTGLAGWYGGPTLVQQIDSFRAPERAITKPLRLCVSDVFKAQGSGVSVAGVVLTGAVQPADRLLLMPHNELTTVKGVLIDDLPAQYAFAGDNVLLVLTGIEMANITVGSILCSQSQPIRAASCFRARIVLFDIDVPITKGFPVVFHYQSLSAPAHVQKLVSQLHKSTGEVVKKRPRCLTRGSTAVVDLRLGHPVCLELYRDFKQLGRFMLRHSGATIAAGLVTEILDKPVFKND